MVGDKEVGDLPTIADDLVVTKYKMAAEIVNSEFKSQPMWHCGLTLKIFGMQLFHDPIIHPLNADCSSNIFNAEVLKEICDGCKPGTSVRDM